MNEANRRSDLERRLDERRECYPWTLVGSSIFAMLLLVAWFSSTTDFAAARETAEKYSVWWFALWWALCYTMSGIKVKRALSSSSRS